MYKRQDPSPQAATVVIVMKKIESMIIAEEETEGQIVFDEEIILPLMVTMDPRFFRRW